ATICDTIVTIPEQLSLWGHSIEHTIAGRHDMQKFAPAGAHVLWSRPNRSSALPGSGCMPEPVKIAILAQAIETAAAARNDPNKIAPALAGPDRTEPIRWPVANHLEVPVDSAFRRNPENIGREWRGRHDEGADQREAEAARGIDPHQQ